MSLQKRTPEEWSVIQLKYERKYGIEPAPIRAADSKLRTALEEIVKLSDPCLFINWQALRANIRRVAEGALK